MEDELTTVQRRLDRAVRNTDLEIQRLEPFLPGDRALLHGSAEKRRKPNIDPHFEIRPPRHSRDPGLVITPEDAWKRKRLIAELRLLMLEIGSQQMVLKNMRDLEAKIRRDIARLKGDLFQNSRDMANLATASEELEKLRGERKETERALDRKNEAMRLAIAAVREQERRIRKLRKEIAEKGGDLRFLLQARNRPRVQRQRRRRRGRGVGRALALLGSRRIRL